VLQSGHLIAASGHVRAPLRCPYSSEKKTAGSSRRSGVGQQILRMRHRSNMVCSAESRRYRVCSKAVAGETYEPSAFARATTASPTCRPISQPDVRSL
jgi:hypothetical protein